ncbi:hypothetical protein KKJ03_20795, partial [Xenorhabdus bovienii]|nr:hypothetical protein [Xenorhabdus bovienii]
FTPLLPALQSGDWRELLTPVNELMIDTPEPVCYYRPENCSQVLTKNLFVLGDHLQRKGIFYRRKLLMRIVLIVIGLELFLIIM